MDKKRGGAMHKNIAELTQSPPNDVFHFYLAKPVNGPISALGSSKAEVEAP